MATQLEEIQALWGTLNQENKASGVPSENKHIWLILSLLFVLIILIGEEVLIFAGIKGDSVAIPACFILFLVFVLIGIIVWRMLCYCKVKRACLKEEQLKWMDLKRTIINSRLNYYDQLKEIENLQKKLKEAEEKCKTLEVEKENR